MHYLSKLVSTISGALCIACSAGCGENDAPTGPADGSTVVTTGGHGGTGSGGASHTGGTAGSSKTATSLDGGRSSPADAVTNPGDRTDSGGGQAPTDSAAGTPDARAAGDARGRNDTKIDPDGKAGAGGTTGTGDGSVVGGSTGTPGKLKKFFGNIDTRGAIRSDFASMWDQFSPENAGKWGSVQGSSQSSFNWSTLDKMYKYCQDNNIVFKEHCFIWGTQQPGFVNKNNAEEAVKAWMKAFCERYPDTRVIDVVNEPLHTAASYRDGIGGAGSSGWDWIVNALKWAREACPNAMLVVNEYNTIEYSNENGRIISLTNAVKKAGGPIDAVGAQSHDISKVSQSTMTSFGEKIISDTGLPLFITEMDIGITDDNQQAQKMKDFVTWAWKNDNIPGITYWGYIVGATWRNGTGLMTDAGSKRPALTWLLDFLGR